MAHVRVVDRNPLGNASSWPNAPDVHLVGQRAQHEVDEGLIPRPHWKMSMQSRRRFEDLPVG